MKQTQTDAPQPKPTEAVNWIIVGLAVLIVVTLAGLWVMERSGRAKAERLAADLRRKNQLVGQMLIDQARPGVVIDRTALPTRPLSVDGRDRTALLLSAAQARLLGFAPGDLVLVTDPPRTAPAEPR